MATTQERVTCVIGEQLGLRASEVKPEHDFIRDLGADSLDTIEIVMALEDEFEIEISDADAEKIETVQQALDYFSKVVDKA